MTMLNKSTFSNAGWFAAAVAMSTPVAAPVQAGANVSCQVISLAGFRGMQQAGQWSVIRQKLASWKALSDDWDTDGARAPIPSVISASNELIDDLLARGAPLPAITLATDGEIAFEWVKGSGFASVSFTDDGHIIGFLREDASDKALRIDEPYARSASIAFLDRIGSFA